MASVTGYTADRMQEIEDQAVVGGAVVGDDLILTRHNDETINAGNVRGDTGPAGPPGGLGEAPVDGPIYGRKEEEWVAIPASGVEEAPTDGGARGVYARYNVAWIVAPGTVLDAQFNSGDSSTALNTAVAMAGAGTKVTVPVGQRGVTVTFGAQIGHAAAGKFVGLVLYIDGAAQDRGKPLAYISDAGAALELQREAVYRSGDLSIADHVFEVKAKQPVGSASMQVYESWISVRAN